VDEEVEEVRLGAEAGSVLVAEGEAEVEVVSREEGAGLRQGDEEVLEVDFLQGEEGRSVLSVRMCRMIDEGSRWFCKFQGVYGILWHVLLSYLRRFQGLPNKRIIKVHDTTCVRVSCFEAAS
jgi:hypothetical protein